MKKTFMYIWNYDVLNKIAIIILILASIWFLISLIDSKNINKKYTTDILPEKSIIPFVIIYAAVAIITTNTIPLNRDYKAYEKQKQKELDRVLHNVK